MNRKKRITCIILSAMALLIAALSAYICYDKKAQSEIKEKEYRVVFNNCYAYERLNTEYISSEHNGGVSFFTKENSDGTVIEVDGYKHIHYAVFNEADELFCAAISEDGKRFLLKINLQNEAIQSIEVNTLPVKLYSYKDSVVAYYIGHEAASLYSVDFSAEALNLIVDDVTVYNSYDYQRYLKGELNLEEYFYYTEWEAECYRETKDLGYTFFDDNCVDEVLVSDEAILYKSKTAENKNQWTLLKDGEKVNFENKDVCLGFTDNNTPLFYKQFLGGFFRCYGIIYEYNVENGKKSQVRFTVNQGLFRAQMYNDGEYIVYYVPDFGGGEYRCVLTQSGADAYLFSFYEFRK